MWEHGDSPMPAIKANPSQRLSCGGSLLCSLQRFNIGSFIEQIIYLIAAAGLESVTFLIALNSKFSSALDQHFGCSILHA